MLYVANNKISSLAGELRYLPTTHYKTLCYFDTPIRMNLLSPGGVNFTFHFTFLAEAVVWGHAGAVLLKRPGDNDHFHGVC